MWHEVSKTQDPLFQKLMRMVWKHFHADLFIQQYNFFFFLASSNLVKTIFKTNFVRCSSQNWGTRAKGILRWIFCHKRDENGKWRRLHNAKLYSLYLLPNIVRRLRWTGHLARREEIRNTLKILTGKLTGKGILWRPGRL